MGALSLDGTPTTGQSTGSTTCAAAAFSNSLTNDIIIACVTTEKGGTANTVSGIADTAGLSWAKKTGLAFTTISGFIADVDVEIWWAYSSGVLTNDTVTATLTAVGSVNPDGTSIAVFAVNGCTNFSNPWDGNGSLPGTATNLTSTPTQPEVTGIATTAVNTYVIGVGGSSSNGLGGTPGGTFSKVAYTNGGATNYCAVDVAGAAFTSPQSALTVSLESSVADDWGVIVVALSDGGGGGGKAGHRRGNVSSS